MTNLRFFFFTAIISKDTGGSYANKFFKSEVLPDFHWVEEQIKLADIEPDKVNKVFILDWKEMSQKDWLTATGQVPAKVQSVTKSLIKSLK